MATSIATLRTELRSRLGGRSATAITDTRLDFLLRHAIEQLSSPRVHRHPTLETTIPIATVSGTSGYSLTQGGVAIWTIFSVRDTTAGNVRRLTNAGIQFMDELVRTSGFPLRYARWGQALELDPIPDGIYNLVVRGYRYPAFDPSGNSPLDDVYNEGILLGAESRGWLNVLQNPERGLVVKNQLADWMDTIISPYDGEMDDNAADVLAPDLYGTLGLGR